MKKKLKNSKLVIALSLLLMMFSQPSALAVGTVPVDGNCVPECDGYYAKTHFAANFQVTQLPATGYYRASNFRLTLTTPGNENGDQWGLMTLDVYSDGYLALRDISKASDLRTETGSSHWVTLNNSASILKGKNRVEFRIGYILRYPNGSIYNRFYPIRVANNVN